ncbi:MAG: hypothetical protein AAF297_12715 [Planctomycetota bacterium]
MPKALAVLVSAVTSALLTTSNAFAGPLFELDGVAPDRVIVTTGPVLTSRTPPDAPMLRALLGVRAVHNTPRELRVLKAALGRLTDDAPDAVRTIAYLHLIYEQPEQSRTIVSPLVLLETPEGDQFARHVNRHNAENTNTVEMNERALGGLIESWGRAAPPRADPTAEADHPVARTFDLPQPYTASPISMNPRTLTDRFFRGRPYPEGWDTVDRVLADESFNVRLPKGFDPRRPAGLLVWQSPTPDGTIPHTIYAGADELGLICIGAHNSGNFRQNPERGDPADRFQLVLDAIATAQATWWIDPDRLYVTGLSGGGRITSMMWCCFPDLVKGGVAMVGLNSPHTVPIRPNFVSPPNYIRPALKYRRLTKTQRLAGITGTEDYNEPEMVLRTKEHQDDGVAVRLWNLEGMGHTFPPSETFTEALLWIDEPVRTKRNERLADAQSLLNAYIDAFGPIPPPSAAAREQLIEIARIAPWTNPAWTAADYLGITGN